MPADSADGSLISPADGEAAIVPQPASNNDAVNPLETTPEFQAARQALREGDVDRCEQSLRELYARRPNFPPPRMMLARAMLEEGQPRIARALLEDIAGGHMNSPELYLLCGQLALLEGRIVDATVHLEKARALAPPENWTQPQRRTLDLEILAGETLIAERRGEWAKASQLYQRQVAAAPTDARLRIRWAYALYHHRKLAQAYEQADAAYRQNSDIDPPELILAVMFAQDKKYREADEWFGKAVDKFPDNPDVYFTRSVYLMHEDKADAAERAAAKAAELGLDSRALLMHRGDIAVQQGKFERAEEFYRFVRKRQPQDIGVAGSLAIALVQQKNPQKLKEAVTLMEKIAGEHPNSPLLMSALGWVQYHNGQLAEAAATLEAAANAMPTEPTTLYFLSVVLMKADRKEDAVQVARHLQRVIAQPGLFFFRPAARKWLAQVLPQDE